MGQFSEILTRNGPRLCNPHRMKNLKPREVRSLAWHHPKRQVSGLPAHYLLIHTHDAELVPATQAMMGRPPQGSTDAQKHQLPACASSHNHQESLSPLGLKGFWGPEPLI